MLLFNNMTAKNASVYVDFNTSNVTIQPLYFISSPLSKSHFNTSNVTIQQHLKKNCPWSFGISIHLMLLFNYYN